MLSPRTPFDVAVIDGVVVNSSAFGTIKDSVNIRFESRITCTSVDVKDVSSLKSVVGN